jgi:Putative MetA-pathway of phenol degradation
MNVQRAYKHLVISVALFLTADGLAQDLEPRAYSASPVGLNFVVVGFGRSSGSVLVDPNLQIADVEATFYSPTVGLGRTFGLFGRQSLVTAALPYVWGDVSGNVAEERRSITRSGLADLRAKFSINLRGNPAMSPAEFARLKKPAFIIGSSLTVIAPTGQYDPAKLVNIGTNRWAFKPEIGISYPVKKFYLDAYFGAWLFTQNSDFFPGGNVRQQDPVTTLQGHVSYTFRPHLWLAADVTWYRGGATSVDNGPSSTQLNNSRAGVTLSLPLSKRQSVKLAFSDGTTSRLGTDFKTLSVAWQFAWFGGIPSR